MKVDFCDNWTFMNVGSEQVNKITVPHDAMLGESRSLNSPGKGYIAWFLGGKYIYRKEFTIPEIERGKLVFFEFEGVYQTAEIYINGTKTNTHVNGYTSILVNATPFIKYDGLNQIEVRVNNDRQPNSRWYTGSGIYRPVSILYIPIRHIQRNGVKIKTVSIEPALLELDIETSHSGDVSISILNKKGECVHAGIYPSDLEVKVQIPILNAELWSCETPTLYNCIVTFEEDEVVETFGIRMIQLSKERGLLINGNRVILRGACLHHDNGILGACGYPEADRRKIKIIKEQGFNAIRSAHNPCSKSMLSACDRLGVLVMDEYSDMWFIHKNQYDYALHLQNEWRNDLRSMVEKNFNHPSVILYSIGNEVAETSLPSGIKLTKDMTQFLHELDGTRPVTCGINIFFNWLYAIGFGVYSDEKAKKGKTTVGSEFYNKLAGIFGATLMKFGATTKGCDQKTKDAFYELDIAGYNYGIMRYKKDLKQYPDRFILGTETFCADAAVFWKLAQANTRILGDFVWAGFDYLGEVGVGAWEYEEYAPDFNYGLGWISAGSGRIDLTGNPLAEARYMKVAYGLDIGPVIAVRPLDNNGVHSPSAWKMTNAMESWSWNGCEGKKAFVEIYAQGVYVELHINNTFIGRRKLNKKNKAFYKVPYQSGEIVAKVYDKSHELISENKLISASPKTVLAVRPEQAQGKRGEVIFIPISYEDESGILKPVDKGSIRVEVKNGKLIGLGNGCPYNEDSYLSDITRTYYGKAMAVVKLSGEGNLEIVADDGIRKGQAMIQLM